MTQQKQLKPLKYAKHSNNFDLCPSIPNKHFKVNPAKHFEQFTKKLMPFSTSVSARIIARVGSICGM